VAAGDDGADRRGGGDRAAAAIAIDVLFAEPDDRSPAALARRLGSVPAAPRSVRWEKACRMVTSGWRRAIGSVPVALGFVLDPDRHSTLPGAAVASRGSLPFDDLWQAAGAIGPTPPLAAAASGLGALRYLVAPMEPSVRSRSSSARSCPDAWPGYRGAALASGASSYLVEGEPRRWWSAAAGLRCRAMRCPAFRWQHGVASPARYPRSECPRGTG